MYSNMTTSTRINSSSVHMCICVCFIRNQYNTSSFYTGFVDPKCNSVNFILNNSLKVMPINNFFMFIKSLCADSPSKKHMLSQNHVFSRNIWLYLPQPSRLRINSLDFTVGITILQALTT